jgi:hypothetical protein
MGEQVKHLVDEQDIGSGEKSSAQKDIERETRSVDNPQLHGEHSQHGGHPQDGSQFPQVIEEQKYADQRPSAEEQRPRHGNPHGDLPGHILRSGDHIARILTEQLPDGTYEAQVYVRLEREPEVAETYIPAGTFPSEAEAWKAAEERANRAFKEHEF